MYKALKIELKLTVAQKIKVCQTIGTERFIYNEYIKYNQEQYELGNKFVDANDFSKYINNVYLPNNPDKKWIKDVSSKSVKQAIIYGEKAFKNFFKGLSAFPVFKKKGRNELGAYFVKNNKKDFEFYRHKIKIPTLKFVRVKEYGYIPKNVNIKSGTITKIVDKYFLSLIIEIEDTIKVTNTNTKGLGIDLGIKDIAICSDGKVFQNINKTKKVKKLKKKLKREQRKMSRSIGYSKSKKIKLKELKNFNKKKLKVQKIFYRLNCIRDDYNNKIVNEITRAKLKYITIEDLKVFNMIKNKHLSKAIQEQNFHSIRTKLINKCKERNIELRIVDIFYPSSKTCSCCGSVKKDLKLNDRIYKCCNCGLEMDRDYNASINLEKAKVYKIIA
ncbi:RNA-guided endonuclease InsQ/TnpB family protein [Fusobacterium hwasookii]|uniref:RNA-guided endonuclease InsQ/TnpB family protein n=1 Tax=Fusobacterium hwasookii TaxID=1583098 RepID=UPI000497090C|nr:RNA-guided endonuclease TnpB family protein [Fusobacterium hwasookii]QNE68735.1 transposase [Fusobacterium hwasookii]QYR54206.1 transposase [Fusobacterium hwasookii]